ncbi:MAG: hypothetical protein LBQ06_02855 [Frankiaceae bacterium]|nr:hypothetical protein [Frankiaceae bacterium]
MPARARVPAADLPPVGDLSPAADLYPDGEAEPVPAPRRSRNAAGAQRRSRAAAAGFYLLLGVASAAAAIRQTGVSRRGWGIPLSYSGDALSVGAQFKAVLEQGWYYWNPALGAPGGQQYRDYPMADNLHLIVARMLGLATDQWAVALNAYYILTFALTAMAGAWFIRLVGGGWTSSFAFGWLYGFAPYHFQRGEDHLYLAAYYPVPLVAGLAFQILRGRPIWARRPSARRWNPLGWATARTGQTLLILAITGTASSYYSVFALFFLVLAGLGATASRRSWRPGLAAAPAMGALLAAMLANMAPNLLYERSRPPNIAALIRTPEATEIYALKFAQLVLPVQWSRIPALLRLRAGYDRDWPLPSEAPQLGLIAAAGFLFLIGTALAVVLPVAGRAGAGRSPVWAAQSRLAFLTVGGFLVGTVGGVSTLFALLVSGEIRAWNRISIFLSLFALAAAALGADRGGRAVARRVRARGPRGAAAATAGVCALAVLVGMWDQVPPRPGDVLRAQESQWRSDDVFARQIAAAVPPGSMIYQMPYMPFPENGPIEGIDDYQLLRPYLHSSGLRWSYGGIKGRPQADWAAEISAMPADRMLVALAAAGFAGIYLDRAGIAPDQRAGLEADIARIAGAAPITSPNQDMAFFSLLGYRQRLGQLYSAGELDQIGSLATAHAVAYWQRDFQPPSIDEQGRTALASKDLPSSAMIVDNPRGEAAPLDISFTLIPSGGPAPVTIVWPDGSRQTLAPDPSGAPIQRTIEAPPGRSAITFSTKALTAIPITLLDWSAVNPLLQTFPVLAATAGPG